MGWWMDVKAGLRIAYSNKTMQVWMLPIPTHSFYIYA
jgi:hypothetical protein